MILLVTEGRAKSPPFLVAVVGKVAEISFCNQGTTLEVQKITAAKPAG
jgi:hypothetical protein